MTHPSGATDRIAGRGARSGRAPLLPPLAAAAVWILWPTAAHAYVGPGVAVGTVVLVLGVLGALLLWVFVLVWHPLKRLWWWRRGSGSAADTEGDAAPPADTAPR